jgi:hypothetical protein
MIYIGTLLISVVSFFTTYLGLTIIVTDWLALLGSLGLQLAMLGIAWNIMHIKGSRFPYVVVFAVAACFSIFFSYANFNSNLKASTRALRARADHAAASRPVMRQYAARAKEALFRGGYQVGRIGDLLEMEAREGWATRIDEGSRDEYVQEVIEGARRTVASWREHQGTDYRQGSGEGIIVGYLESWLDNTRQNLDVVAAYARSADSIALVFAADMPVSEQQALVNRAVVDFPAAEVAMIIS